MSDPPSVRIDDADRARAMQELSAHLDAGHLSRSEFDNRTATVAAARTRGELTVPLDDLVDLAARRPTGEARQRLALSSCSTLTSSALVVVIVAAVVDLPILMVVALALALAGLSRA